MRNCSIVTNDQKELKSNEKWLKLAKYAPNWFYLDHERGKGGVDICMAPKNYAANHESCTTSISSLSRCSYYFELLECHVCCRNTQIVLLHNDNGQKLKVKKAGFHTSLTDLIASNLFVQNYVIWMCPTLVSKLNGHLWQCFNCLIQPLNGDLKDVVKCTHLYLSCRLSKMAYKNHETYPNHTLCSERYCI